MTTVTCAARDCSDPVKSRGYCERHYRRRLHTGRYGYQDATEVRAHVERLRELGWTWGQIGEAAGMLGMTVREYGIGWHRGSWRASR